jgi:hypothetical protein
MNDVLLVPIHLDALVLSEDKMVVEAVADFSRLPYCDGKRDVNPDVANISEEIVSPPFQNQNLPLKVGIHLHWSLPDALTRSRHGQDDPGNQDFPRVPNRWLVTRCNSSDVLEKEWIVESDYLYPEGNEDHSAQSVTIPYRPGNSQPFRYMGRSMELSAGSPGEMAEYYPKLTAVGYGEPTFAAFYPNCHSVFGFYDPDCSAKPGGRRYYVVGWYSAPEQDYLSEFIEPLVKKGKDSASLKGALEDDFKWTLTLTEGQLFPARMLCYANLVVGEAVEDQPADESVTVAVGNTGTEALSSYLAATLAGQADGEIKNDAAKNIIEDQLEALQLSSKLEHRQLDVGAKFLEARHEKGFTAVPGGPLWTVGPEAAAASAADAGDAQAGVTLPDEMAHLLNAVNGRQQDYDRAWQEIESMRRQLFSDWYKYMLCSYPPEDARDEYPNIDEVKGYIEANVDALRQSVEQAGTVTLKDEGGEVSASCDGSAPGSHATALALAAAINKLQASADSHNDGLKDAKSAYRLKQVAGPRYWRPTEPVVLIEGSIAKASERHGQDGRSGDGLLETHVLADADMGNLADQNLRQRIRARIAEIKDGGSGENFAFSTWTRQPWNPFLLEWEVEVFPLENKSNLDPASGSYGPDFIIDNYTLYENSALLFRVGDFNDLSGLAVKLRHADEPVSAYLKEKFSAETGRQLEQYDASGPPSESLQSALVDELNQVLKDAGLFNEDRFKQVELSLESHNLNTRGPQGEGLIRLNRTLLAEAFPNEIARIPEIDLSLQPGKGATTGAANLYSGRSILTPHAAAQLTKQIEDYLDKEVLAPYYTARGVPPGQRGPAYLAQQIADVQKWYEDTNASSLATLNSKDEDPSYTAIRAWQALNGLNCLSQSLGGFNEALLMHKQTMQLSVGDPLGFDDYRSFAASVSDAVSNSIYSAPEPLNDFNPIRSGAMNINRLRLRLVDTFGQVKDLDVTKVITSEPMSSSDDDFHAHLAPRLVQPARINFRWLAAEGDEQEMNDHPATTPVCGWVLTNDLDNSLMIYDGGGKSLGSLVTKGADSPQAEVAWEPAPGGGADSAGKVDEIKNSHLRTMVASIQRCGAAFLSDFISAVDNALENIEPENFAQHQDIALLMGRPLALVRASLNLELQGPPAVHQGWNEFRQDMKRATRDDNGFSRVRFPIRVGDYKQFNDGTVGFWKELCNGEDRCYEGDVFYAPQSDADAEIKDSHLKSHRTDPMTILQSASSEPQILSLLLDPRGLVHATSGVLPAKAINIPPDQYAAALRAIEITFLSTPVLTDAGKIHLPLPAEAGYEWSWLQDVGGTWSEVSTGGVVQKAVIDQFGPDAWDELIAKKWIEQIDPGRASVRAKDRRSQDPLPADLADKIPEIEDLLDRSHIGPASPEAKFSGPQEIREGWLKLSADGGGTA